MNRISIYIRYNCSLFYITTNQTPIIVIQAPNRVLPEICSPNNMAENPIPNNGAVEDIVIDLEAPSSFTEVKNKTPPTIIFNTAPPMTKYNNFRLLGIILFLFPVRA